MNDIGLLFLWCSFLLKVVDGRFVLDLRYVFFPDETHQGRHAGSRFVGIGRPLSTWQCVPKVVLRSNLAEDNTGVEMKYTALKLRHGLTTTVQYPR